MVIKRAGHVLIGKNAADPKVLAGEFTLNRTTISTNFY